MSPTKIEWTDETWNPITGCTPISEGCAHCYAKRMAQRLAGRYGYPKDDPFRVTVHADKLGQPTRWRKPRRVFVCSMGDLFHEDVKGTEINMVWNEAFNNPRHTFMFLTKRPDRLEWWTKKASRAKGWPIDEIWPDWMRIGTTVENQARADERIPILLQIPAAVRFVSIEPMLGPVDLRPFKLLKKRWGEIAAGLDWVIVGGETGPGARVMRPEWARSVRDQCKSAGVPFFMKKMSGGGKPPADLLIREYPKEEGRKGK